MSIKHSFGKTKTKLLWTILHLDPLISLLCIKFHMKQGIVFLQSIILQLAMYCSIITFLNLLIFVQIDVSRIIEKFNVNVTLAIIPRTKDLNKAFWLVHIFIKTLSFSLFGGRIWLFYNILFIPGTSNGDIPILAFVFGSILVKKYTSVFLENIWTRS